MAGGEYNRNHRPLWVVLHARQLYEVGAFRIFFSYPLLPWIGVMFLGFGAAGLFELPEKQRRELVWFASVWV